MAVCNRLDVFEFMELIDDLRLINFQFMWIKNLRLVLMALFTLSLHFGFAQDEKAAAELKSIMTKRNVVGLAVAVVKDGKLIYAKSFGVKNIATNAPLTNETMFRIASISKSFAATAIMQLLEAKKIGLEDDFGKLVGFPVRNPKFPDRIITLKMVLSHTSSINDTEGYFNLDVINPAKNPNWEKCYNAYEPGEGYQYCNLNFNLTGAVIEKISGVRFDLYIKRQILDPLGLYAGYCVDSLDQTKFATLYEFDVSTQQFMASPAAYNPRSEEIKSYKIGYQTPIFSPTGGMKISATDLAKYMTVHLNYGKYGKGRLISRKSSKMMQTKQSDEESYGLALRSDTTLIAGETMVGHTGSAYGLYSAMFFNPKSKFGIVVITNGCKPTFSNGFCETLSESINSLYRNFIQ